MNRSSEGTVERVRLIVDGVAHSVEPGITLAAALLNIGSSVFRRSVTGEARGPVCGMGICHECHATVDGIAHRRTCLVTVADGMHVETAGAVP